jgi:hypothetical protein
MAKHSLSLNIPDIMEDCVLRIEDTSVYSSLIPVTCPTLQVLAPGFVTATKLNDTTTPVIGVGFTVNLNACDLELQTEECGTEFYSLPDGVYVIKYSVSPNDLVYVEYNHLRINKAMAKYKAILCDLDLGACEPPIDKVETLNKLLKIKMYLEAAKAKVEFCGEPDKGMTIYNYALKLLDKMNCSTC